MPSRCGFGEGEEGINFSAYGRALDEPLLIFQYSHSEFLDDVDLAITD